MMPDAPTLVLLVIIGLLALSLVSVSAGLVFNIRAQRLPAATRYEDVRERLAVSERLLTEREARLREVEQMIHDRDRYAAEAASLREQVETLRREYENLGPAREEIEQVKSEAAAAASDKTTIEQELKALREEEERLRVMLDPERIARLREEQEALLRERDRIKSELETAKTELEAALRTIGESRTIEARVAMLEAQRDALETENAVMQDRAAELGEVIDEARSTRDGLVAEAREAERHHDVAKREAERRHSEQAALNAEVQALKALAETLKKGLDLTVNGSVGDAGVLTEEDKAAILKDLVAEPACLALPALVRGTARLESEALHQVDTYLRESGLTFHRRTVRAFHTALKVNDTAQLTVLAGVSGTGKSLLPRRYADAMGIHFLQIAVEPRWDSPQDLLGFYNYVEKKYRATELSRLMVHMDPWNSHSLPGGVPNRRDHMAMVLLDEMNLARVEYYFSEFLSRLEARPAWDERLSRDADRGRAKDAMIPVDIRGLDDPPMLFPAHNILFVGTMNDDESTQSLSDKVLDRGNVLQFPAPDRFPKPTPANVAPSTDAQQFSEWRGWINPGRALDLPPQVDEVVGKLAGIMQDFGKPFGHRLNQSMRAYVAQYPREGNSGLDIATPLADQIEFRILPKLRGVEIGNHRTVFDALDQLLRGSQINDATLADKVAETAAAQENTTGLFVWRGLSRGV
jgi:hypothetical protein